MTESSRRREAGEPASGPSRESLLDRLNSDVPVTLDEIITAQEDGTLTDQDMKDVPALRAITDSAETMARAIGTTLSGLGDTSSMARAFAGLSVTDALSAVKASGLENSFGALGAMQSSLAGIHEAATHWSTTLSSVESVLGSLRLADVPAIPEIEAPPTPLGRGLVLEPLHNYQLDAIIDVREELIAMTKVLRTAGGQIEATASVSMASMDTLKTLLAEAVEQRVTMTKGIASQERTGKLLNRLTVALVLLTLVIVALTAWLVFRTV